MAASHAISTWASLMELEEKEILTRGDRLLSVIAGPWRGLCHLGDTPA